ncbi:MAG: class I SAM-dependent methyltransferase [Candidatus Methanoperedenaceae archaeon]|nr:class I SAM-dependent methyltransferase [Candidatus Methanoperedenaceae archaeon]
MLIHDILELGKDENIYLVEESYSSLKNIPLSLHYLEGIHVNPPDGIAGVEDENGDIIALSFFNQEEGDIPGFRPVFTNLVSSIPGPNNSSLRFSEITGKLSLAGIYKTTRDEFNTALMEYYSRALVDRQLCENCITGNEPYGMVYFESRNLRLKELVGRFDLPGKMLEICCGNGMSTLPLHDMGYNPVTIDIDKCQVCQGLEHHVLKPERTVVMDATRLSQFFPPVSFDTITGFMLGTIYGFNKRIWEKMMHESVKLLKPDGIILLTVNRKEEMDILDDALAGQVHGEIIDNTDDMGIYDQWVYAGYKS